MKRLITFLAMVVLFSLPSITSFGQPADEKQPLSKTEYLKKRTNQKTAAWILTGAGTAGLIITLTKDVDQSVGNGLTSLFSLGTAEPEYKSYTTQYLLSAAGVIAGTALFIAAAKNKKRAMAASAFIDIEKAPVLQKTLIGNQSFAVLGLKIRW